MKPLPSVASELRWLTSGAVGSLLAFLFPTWHGPRRKYRPENHYMRGPGPKWREKHPGERFPASGT
ncbi:hypothetical protein [Bradyrhizobium sp. NP1]|uniref:hypothetical protein n=1 Tax=Bradyrhizobium sp. NP1 TaxID=3049772 RepID=UPI0025A52039|nr:hypothetical protein [Bradyrhizobium sp. NP1]WJR77183.1 hypothetical protein QOU61_31320 [Bradyrhizobium sp. NP1]